MQLQTTETNGKTTPQRRLMTPPVDVFEGAEDILLKLDVPGVAKDAVDVRFHDGSLTVEATRGEDLAYVRSFRVPRGLDGSGARAEMKDGVLNVTLPRAAEAKPHRIAVS